MLAKQDFAVPLGAGAYAPDVLYLTADGGRGTQPDRIGRLSVLIAALPAGAIVELDLLKPGAQTSAGDASYYLAVATWNTAALQALLELANWVGGRIRVKSGGTAGTLSLAAAWDRTAS